MGRMKWEDGRNVGRNKGAYVQAGVTWTRQDRRLWAHFRAGLLSPESGLAPSDPAASATGCGPLRHTSSARPRSAFRSAPVFSRKPRSLCRKPARHKTRRSGCAAIMHGACAPEEQEAAFPRAEVDHEGRDPIQPPPWRRASEQADVAMTTGGGCGRSRGRPDTWEPGASQGAIGDTSSSLQLQSSQAAAGEGRAGPP